MQIVRPRPAALLAACCALAAGTALPGQAQTTIGAEWTGSPAGLWFNPLFPVQLDPDFVPNPDWDIDGSIEINGTTFQTVRFPSNLPGFNFDVEIANAVVAVPLGVPIRVSNMTFGGLASGVAIEAGGSWGIMSGSVEGGFITVNALAVDSIFTDLTIDGTATFTGGGSITLGDSLGSRVTGGTASAFSDTLVLEDYTLSGGGFVGNESMSLRVLADGVVRADATTPLVIDPGADNNIVNMGLMEAVDGATLRIQQTALVNTGGTLNAGIDSQVLLQEVTLTGGSLTGLGEVRAVAGVTLENTVNNSTRYIVGNGTTTVLDGELNNLTIVEIDGGSFLFNSDTSLVGGGAYLLNDPAAGGTSVLAGVGGVLPTVTNVDNTIRGGGTLGFMTFINQSAVIADAPGAPLTILAGTVENQGTMSADGAELNIRSAGFNNTGGTIDATGGVISLTNGGHVEGGTITLDGASTLRLSDGMVTGAVVNNAAGGTIETGVLGGLIDGLVTNPSGGTIRIADDSALTFTQQGTYTNAGTLEFAGSGAFASFANTALRIDGIVTLTGGGTVELGASGDGTILAVPGSDSVFVNEDNTIQGAGHIGRNALFITNRALINANTPPNGTPGSGILFIDPGNGGAAGMLTNTGTMQASNGGTLHLLNGAYENAGGTIQALAGSTVNIDQGTHLFGGSLRSAGGTVEVLGNDVLFDGVGMEIDAQVNVQSAGRLRLRGDITNRQTISLAGSAQVLIDGTVTLTGGGTLHLGDAGTRLTTLIDGTPDLLVNVDNTISGTGSVLFLDIQSGGTLAPGNSPGTLTTGNYTQTADGTLQIELAGAAAGAFDVLNVQGVADLGGTLEVLLLPGLDVSAGTTFDVVTAQSLTVDFDTLALPTGTSGQNLIAVEQVGNTLRLTALEDISVPIPEPGTGALLGLALLGIRRRRRV